MWFMDSPQVRLIYIKLLFSDVMQNIREEQNIFTSEVMQSFDDFTENNSHLSHKSDVDDEIKVIPLVDEMNKIRNMHKSPEVFESNL